MERLTRLALRRPFAACAVLLLVSAGLASQIPKRGTQTGYRAYLGAGHPTVARLDEFIDGFGGGLPIAAIWSCEETDACENVFDGCLESVRFGNAARAIWVARAETQGGPAWGDA